MLTIWGLSSHLVTFALWNSVADGPFCPFTKPHPAKAENKGNETAKIDGQYAKSSSPPTPLKCSVPQS